MKKFFEEVFKYRRIYYLIINQFLVFDEEIEWIVNLVVIYVFFVFNF